MKKLLLLALTAAAMFAFTACGDYSSTKDNHSTTDSHDVTTTTVQTSDANSTDGNTTEVIDSNSTLEVPTFNGNSQGKLVVQCSNRYIRYIGAYDCLKTDTKPTVTASSGDLIVDNDLVHEVEVYYTDGYIERVGSESVTITMKVFSGGVDLNQTWVETCE